MLMMTTSIRLRPIDRYFDFRKEAEKIRTKQLVRLAKEQKQKDSKIKEEKTEIPDGIDNEIGF